MEDKIQPPSFFKSNKNDNQPNIHLFPVCKTTRTQSLSSNIKLGSPLQLKRPALSPVEGTPIPRHPRLLSPVSNVQQELIEVFASESENIPTKADLLNMDLMSNESMFRNDTENPSDKWATKFPFGSEHLNSSVASNQNLLQESVQQKVSHTVSPDCQSSPPPPNEALGLAAIIKLIKDTVIEAMLPLKEEICSLKTTISKLKQNPLPQEQNRNFLYPIGQNPFPQPQLGQFRSEDIRHNTLSPQITKSPIYNASTKNWGLVNQGRGAKPYSKTLSKQTEIVNSSVPNLQPAPAMRNQVVTNPAYELARRCMGFHPITSVDVGTIGGHHVDNESEDLKFQLAGKESVRKFLHLEMDMSVS